MLEVLGFLFCVFGLVAAAPFLPRSLTDDPPRFTLSRIQGWNQPFLTDTYTSRIVLINCIFLVLVLLLYTFLVVEAFVHQAGCRASNHDNTPEKLHSQDKGKSRASPSENDSQPDFELGREMKTATSDSTLASTSTGRTLVAPPSSAAASTSNATPKAPFPFPMDTRSPSADELERFGEAASPRTSMDTGSSRHDTRTRKVALRPMRPSSLERSCASRSVPVTSRPGLTSTQAEARLVAVQHKHSHLTQGATNTGKESPLLPTWLPPGSSVTYSANIEDDATASDGVVTECFPFEDDDDDDGAGPRAPSRFYAMHLNTSITDLHGLTTAGRKQFQPIMPPLRNSRRHAAFSKQIARDFGAHSMTLQPVPASPSPYGSEDAQSSPGSSRLQNQT